ncbi:MAG: LpqB family beta-propeller domain-containing protein [Marmoricola sp.]
MPEPTRRFRLSRLRGTVTALLAGALLVAGCSTLPTSGQVHTRPDTDPGAAGQAPYFAPPGPTKGDDRAGVVRGFLLAMQANPPSTAVARQFLSERARTTWKPVQGTVVYNASTVEPTNDSVIARFNDAHRLDPAGGWVQGTGGSISVEFRLVQDDGEWRIENPPNELAVPASYFPSLFLPFTLYFYDSTGTVLVPRRVYVPRGEQTATNLVRGLLAGPGSALSDVATTAFPPRTLLDLAVVVDDSGLAEVPLGPRSLRMSSVELTRVVAQLSRTLRQVPGITRLRLTVDGSPLTLADGQTDASVNSGSDLDPVIATSHDVVGIVGRQVVRDADGTVGPIGGPLGVPGFALRSVALDVERHKVAAVAGNGKRLYLAADEGATTPTRVQTPVTGSNLLRPSFDRFGRLWTVDRTRKGAVVHVVSGGRDRVLRVPGVSGRPISAFTLTRDGARFVATLATGTAPTVLVGQVVRTDVGGVLRVTGTSRVTVPGADLGPATDVVQDSATTVAVLVQPASGSGQVISVELDGSPGLPTAGPDLVPGSLVGLVGSPDPNDPLRVVTADRKLLELTDAGQWVPSATKFLAAAYPQ